MKGSPWPASKSLGNFRAALPYLHSNRQLSKQLYTYTVIPGLTGDLLYIFFPAIFYCSVDIIKERLGAFEDFEDSCDVQVGVVVCS